MGKMELAEIHVWSIDERWMERDVSGFINKYYLGSFINNDLRVIKKVKLGKN